MKKQKKNAKVTTAEKRQLEHSHGSMNPKLSTNSSLDLDTYVRELQIQEQNFYWQRFSAFATLHAGLFVLATSDSITNRIPVYIIGVVLAVAWVFIQWTSLFYVDRIKPFFYDRLETQGIAFKRHWLFNRVKISSTRIGVFVTLVVFFLWLLMLISDSI